jgi:transcriptional regulator with XRE-family HTH domain
MRASLHLAALHWRTTLLTAAQLKAARALVGMEQRALAAASGVSLPTIQRMEASNGIVRGVIESLTRVMAALEAAGVEFINEDAASLGGGRGVRLRKRAE